MRNILAALVAGLWLVLPQPGEAQELSEAQIKELALEAILENPEIIEQAVALLQERQAAAEAAMAAQAVSANRDLLQRDPNAPVLGNPDGDVVIVEFFDYNCPYCKRVAGDVKTLIGDDGNIRLVYREWPILGEGSVFAARAALAARSQQKYEEFHWALMDLAGRAEEGSVLRAAEEVGLDIARLRADMNAPEVEEHIQVSMQLAQVLGLNGTPSFTIGDEIVRGAIPLAEMRSVVEAARAADASQ